MSIMTHIETTEEEYTRDGYRIATAITGTARAYPRLLIRLMDRADIPWGR